MAINPPLFKPLSSFEDVEAARQEESSSTFERSLGITIGNELLTETSSRLNMFVLSGESRIPPSFSAPHNQALGLNYKLVCDTPLLLEKSAMFTNVNFYSASAYVTPRITVKPPEDSAEATHVVFNGCTFVRQAGHGTLPFIDIRDGAKASFIGCRFIGMSGSDEATHLEHGMLLLSADVEMALTGIAGGATTLLYAAQPVDSLETGDYVYVSGTTVTGLNGLHEISSKTASGRFIIPVDTSAVTKAITNVTDTSSLAQCTSASHPLEAGDFIYVYDTGITPTINGQQRVNTKIDANTFTIAVDPTDTTDGSGSYVVGKINSGKIGKYASNATNIQLVGCSRLPDGSAYTQVSGDPLVTKTGCI